jgi:hypothetical protein
VKFDMTAKDFERLTGVSTTWGKAWAAHPERFHTLNAELDKRNPVAVPPSYRWKHIYWMGERDSWAAVLLAKAYLTEHGIDFEVIYDLSELGGFAILTDYTTDAQREARVGNAL